MAHTCKFSTVENKAQTIVVDLDGTLLHTDTLHESVLQLLRDDAIYVLYLPFWLLAGKAFLKQKLADSVELNPATLPYNIQLIEWLKEQKELGHKLVLCTATNMSVAQRIANHLQLFNEVMASDGENNLAGVRKKAALDEAYGEGQYIYAGNSSDDIHVWNGASKGIVVNAASSVLVKAKKITEIHSDFPRLPITLSAWRRVFRFHQWLKNLLIFVPLLAAHRLSETDSLTQLIVTFISFSLCASAVYITNDLLDLESDRQHPRKKHRPFASGLVPISYGVLLAPVCGLVGLALSVYVGKYLPAWLFVYFTLTFAYSIKLKKLVLIDCLTLAALYTLRIVAGAAAVSVPLSFWLLAFSTFIFLSLAFVKRYAELQVHVLERKNKAHGRGYYVTDASLIQTLGIAAGYAAVLVLALYLQGETVTTLYHTPEFIWGSVPLILFWISWMWLKAHRGLMNDDPLVFAVKDRASWAVLIGIGISFAAATFVL
ncbi:MAG: Integral membrane protein [Nitrospira sp.]|jgi:4-hydroxybenzoate polyprenyltransferase/phosphoserine phosphatase|nr:MAG: Integral membrane protein [Nitrospira sp.]